MENSKQFKILNMLLILNLIVMIAITYKTYKHDKDENAREILKNKSGQLCISLPVNKENKIFLEDLVLKTLKQQTKK